MNNKKDIKFFSQKRIIVAIIIATMVLLSCGIFILFIKRIIIPPLFVSWNETELFDKESDVQICLKDRKISVSNADGIIWESPERFKVSDVMLCDIDYDGQSEMVLLSWKRGKYGKSKPSWVKKDEINWSQHIYIYDISNTKVSPNWMASDIGFDVIEWKFADNELVLEDTEGNITYWMWDSWGLKKDLNK